MDEILDVGFGLSADDEPQRPVHRTAKCGYVDEPDHGIPPHDRRQPIQFCPTKPASFSCCGTWRHDARFRPDWFERQMSPGDEHCRNDRQWRFASGADWCSSNWKLGVDPSFAATYAASFGASQPDYRTVLFDINSDGGSTPKNLYGPDPKVAAGADDNASYVLSCSAGKKSQSETFADSTEDMARRSSGGWAVSQQSRLRALRCVGQREYVPTIGYGSRGSGTR